MTWSGFYFGEEDEVRTEREEHFQLLEYDWTRLLFPRCYNRTWKYWSFLLEVALTFFMALMFEKYSAVHFFQKIRHPPIFFYYKSKLKYLFRIFLWQQEDALAQQAFEEARRRTREFEDRDRSHREEMEVRVSQLLAVTG